MLGVIGRVASDACQPDDVVAQQEHANAQLRKAACKCDLKLVKRALTQGPIIEIMPHDLDDYHY